VVQWIHELEEELERLCGLEKVYNFSHGDGDLDGRETLGADFEILAMDAE
jgi:hypothetical protein